ncbi:MAG: helix-turn-helix domain-containing protein [Acetatifactor sp.]|jgi:transcriptional regulator with XRE-family HTH domain|nr:helix-turn-helix domain-containing protein [Acetatifactor sp.]
MIMADKIIELRKKNGWSQEELAEKLNVSRQSVSKWEGAQSVPDLNKVIAMAAVFGVSTDYLLKDEMEQEEFIPEEHAESKLAEQGEKVHFVSMEEANEFLHKNAIAAKQIALGVLMCILSPAMVILLGVAGEVGKAPFTEDQGAIFGVIILFLLIAGAVAIFVRSGIQLSAYEYLEKEWIETEYGVAGMARERKNSYEQTHSRELVLGIVLCILAVIPIFMGALLDDENDMLFASGAVILLALIGCGVYMIVKTSIIWGGFQRLLEDGDYSRDKKRTRSSAVLTIYWAVVTAIYLGYSFFTFDWAHSWIIWPVAGVLSAGVDAIEKMTRRE